MLSFYIHYDPETGTMNTNHPLTTEEFLEKTFLSVRYRTNQEKNEKSEEAGTYDEVKHLEFKNKKGESDDDGTDSEIDEKDENKYYSSVKVFHLKEFAQHKADENWNEEDGTGNECFASHKEESFKGSPNYRDSDIFP